MIKSKSFYQYPQYRLTIFLCFFSNIICCLDRVNISIAAPFIMQAYKWNETQIGFIFSGFFTGYVLFMIPGGVIADRFGSYKTMAAGIACYSLFTFINPFCNQVWTMFLCRYMVGMGQGVNFPSINNLFANHVPTRDQVKVQGFTLSGITLGIVIGFPLGSWILQLWNWPAIFYIFGFNGFILLFLWLSFAPKDPGNKAVVTELPRGPIPWKQLLTHRSSLGLMLSYFCHNYAAALFLVWLPTYLRQVHGFSTAAMGIGAALPALAAGIFMNVSGWFSDYLLKTGKSRDFSRKLMLYSGMGISGLLLLGLVWIHDPYLAVTFLTLSAAAKALSTPAYWALSVDMAPRYAGILSSIMNTSGNVAGVIAPALTGWMISYFSGWNQAIWVGAVVTLLGVGVAFPTVRSSEID
jgi:ACS family glucarate transporter-like MFS transporter